MSSQIKNSLIPEALKGNWGVILAITSLIIIILYGVFYINYILSGKISSQCRSFTSIYQLNTKIKTIVVGENIIVGGTNVSDLPIYNFYVKTSYNSCSLGSFVNDNVNDCILSGIIKQGVRCFDFEIFNIDNKAVISTSTTDNPWMKETYSYVTFSQVLNILINEAMGKGCNNPNDPLFLSLRMKTKSVEVYNNIAALLKPYINQYLLTEKYNYENTLDFGLVTIGELKTKIIIIIESSDTILENSYLNNYANIVIKNNNNTNFKYETFTSLVNDDKDTVTTFTATKTIFVTPDIYNGDPSNPEPASCFARGVQFVGMCYQLFDNYLQAYEYFFDKNGNAFVLKNPSLMPTTYFQEIPENPMETPVKSINIDLGNGSFAKFNT